MSCSSHQTGGQTAFKEDRALLTEGPPGAVPSEESGYGVIDYVIVAAAAKSLQSCPTLLDPMDCSLPGSSIHGIFQARVLEWVAIAFSHL